MAQPLPKLSFRARLPASSMELLSIAAYRVMTAVEGKASREGVVWIFPENPAVAWRPTLPPSWKATKTTQTPRQCLCLLCFCCLRKLELVQLSKELEVSSPDQARADVFLVFVISGHGTLRTAQHKFVDARSSGIG